MKKGLVVLLSIVAIATVVALGAGFYVYKNILNTDTIYKGIRIDGYDVSNKTVEQALDYIKKSKELEVHEKFMNLIYEDRVYEIRLGELGFSYKLDEAVKTAFEMGREGSIVKRLRDIVKIKKGVEIPLESFYEVEKIKKIVQKISNEINREAIDAKIDFKMGSLQLLRK